ncbi:hypothetical protein [Microbacterium foliorum]|uniref:hypothetical protein n=1 Tax=Microbacterium foliorum TaxID=104336 RepID=UPI00209DFB37|nr:hypothetical protein [Microbacterium foliorum]MCP1430051.1 hypothetical protein [Microbacterium foliorum]
MITVWVMGGALLVLTFVTGLWGLVADDRLDRLENKLTEAPAAIDFAIHEAVPTEECAARARPVRGIARIGRWHLVREE